MYPSRLPISIWDDNANNVIFTPSPLDCFIFMFPLNPFLGLSGFQIIPNVQIEENQMNQMLIQQQERLYFMKFWHERKS